MASDKNLYDAIIVGGGPAGLTAALYLGRARYRVLVVEQNVFGGQITITNEVVNYPGVPRTSGKELTESMRQQAESFGAEFLLAEVTGFELSGDIKTAHTSKGDFQAFGILMATGAHPRRLGFAGESDFQGRGVAYCATCDGEFFQDKEVFVVGGGFVAAEESVFLTKYAKHVTICMITEDFTCPPVVAEKARNHPKITVLPHTEMLEVAGTSTVERVRYRNTQTGEEVERAADENDRFGVFVFAGYEPATELVRGIADLDEHGYLLTNHARQTSVEGLFAAGDVCVKSLRQVVTATGEAALASTEMERYLSALQEKTGIVPVRPEVAEPQANESEAASVAVGNSSASQGGASSSELFDEAMLAQLNTVFSRMENNLVLKLFLDERPVSAELQGYMEELARQTDKLSVRVADESEAFAGESAVAPCVQVCREDGTWTGLAFHGVPGGHEFTSFVLGLYNAAGPGQQIDNDARERIAAIAAPVSIKVLVSLSCTMCPDTVVAAQRIAAESDSVQAEVFDLSHFPALRDTYNVMSVPCVVVNDGEQISFGKKTIDQVLGLLP